MLRSGLSNNAILFNQNMSWQLLPVIRFLRFLGLEQEIRNAAT